MRVVLEARIGVDSAMKAGINDREAAQRLELEIDRYEPGKPCWRRTGDLIVSHLVETPIDNREKEAAARSLSEKLARI